MLKNVLYIPGFYVKIFSLMMTIKKGCKISNENMAIIVRRSLFQLEFSQKINCKNSFICAIDLDVQMMSTMVKCPDDYKTMPDILTT